MSLPPQFLDELRNRVTLSEIIGRKIRITRAGREFKACCPFHGEKTPSFTINDQKQFYHCFGCGAHGDAIGFLMQHDNLSFIDAVETLAAEAGMQVPKQSPKEVEKAKRQKDLFALMEEATLFFQHMLYDPKHRDALDYIRDRGLDDEVLKTYRVGFAPDDGQALRRHLIAKGYPDAEMKEVGLTKDSSRGGDPYTFFRGRIMFPVPDRRGRVVAFGGRILPDHLRPPDRGNFTPPKYINSTETALFHKGRMLYGEPHARMAASNGEDLVVVEGYMDAIACARAGFKGALAPMGTALTEEQVLSLWKMIPSETKVPILCFDGDSAGRKAAVRVCERIMPLLEPGKSVRFAFLPEGEDPDTLIRKNGAAALRHVLDKAIPLVDFLWQTATSSGEYKTPELQAGLKKRLMDLVSRVADRDVQSLYRQQLNTRFSETFYSRQENSYRKPLTKGQKFKPRTSPVQVRRPMHHLRSIYPCALIAGVINHPEIYDSVEEEFLAFDTGNGRYDALRNEVVTILSGDSNVGTENIVEILANCGFAQEINDILNESVYVHASFCSPRGDKGAVLSKWLQFWEGAKELALREEIKNTDSSSEEGLERLKNMVLMNSVDRTD